MDTSAVGPLRQPVCVVTKEWDDREGYDNGGPGGPVSQSGLALSKDLCSSALSLCFALNGYLLNAAGRILGPLKLPSKSEYEGASW